MRNRRDPMCGVAVWIAVALLAPGVAVWIAVGLLAPGAALADGAPPDRGPLRSSLALACQMDFDLFCPEVDPESARAEVMACLEANRDALTEECRARVDPGSVPQPKRVPTDPLVAACQDDFARFCGREADRMAFARCVKTHQAKLSGACRDAMAAAAAPGAAAGSGAGPSPP